MNNLKSIPFILGLERVVLTIQSLMLLSIGLLRKEESVEDRATWQWTVNVKITTTSLGWGKARKMAKD